MVRNPALLLSPEDQQRLMSGIRVLRETKEPVSLHVSLHTVTQQSLPVAAVIDLDPSQAEEHFTALLCDRSGELRRQADRLRDTFVCLLQPCCEWIGELNLRENTAQCVCCREGDQSGHLRVSLEDMLAYRIDRQVAEAHRDLLRGFFAQNLKPDAPVLSIKEIPFDKQETAGRTQGRNGLLISLGDERFLFCGRDQSAPGFPPASESACAAQEVLSSQDRAKKRTAAGHIVDIVTFGYFNVLVDGIPIYFSHEKAKELLALLGGCRNKGV